MRAGSVAVILRAVKAKRLGILFLTGAFVSFTPIVFAGRTLVAVEAGDSALEKFDLNTAIRDYRLALQSQPNNYEATWKLCRGLVDEGTLTQLRADQKLCFVEAERLARRAIGLQPEDANGHLYLAIAVGKLALFEGGKRKVELSKEVKVEAEKALALNSNEDIAYHVLGVWHREMAELNWMLKKFAGLLYGGLPAASLDQSLKNLRHAVELAPENVAHQVELAKTFVAVGNWGAARNTIDHAQRMQSTWVTDNYYKTEAVELLGRVNRNLR